eukprot:scaffold183498_cov37-Tisochrysis_lutea.AAC.5
MAILKQARDSIGCYVEADMKESSLMSHPCIPHVHRAVQIRSARACLVLARGFLSSTFQQPHVRGP